MSAATYTAAQLVSAMPRVRLSRMVGRLCEQSLPAPISRVLTAAYARAYGIDLSEVAPQSVPYRSFDAFFTRPLRPGARLVEDAPLVSPAEALMVRADGTQVAVVGPDSIVHLQKIVIGRDYGDRLEVMQGVQVGDRIIFNPDDSAREGVKVEAVEAAEKPTAAAPAPRAGK